MVGAENPKSPNRLVKKTLEAYKAKKDQDSGGIEKKKCNLFIYVTGSIILTAIASVIIPRIMNKTTGVIYKINSRKNSRKENDNDWGPVIEKK